MHNNNNNNNNNNNKMEYSYVRISTTTITTTTTYNNYQYQQLSNNLEELCNNDNQQIARSLSRYSDNNKNNNHSNKNNNHSNKNNNHSNKKKTNKNKKHSNKNKELNHKKKSSIYYNLFDSNKVLIQNQSICDSICIYKNLYNTNENVIHRMFDEYKGKSIYFKNEKQVWNSLKSTMNKFSQGFNSSSIEQEFYQKLNN